MDHFNYRDDELFAEDVPMARIAEHVGTPVYVYSRATLERHARVFRDAVTDCGQSLIAFAVKANPNIAVLKTLALQGFGADVVSGGELERALQAGVKAEKIVFSGVGKTEGEMRQGIEREIGQFNIESLEEGRELAGVARASGRQTNAALRVNPDIDAGTHAKISTGKADSKFGVSFHRAREIYGELSGLDGLHMRGLAVHIGSQLASLAPLEAAFKRLGVLLRDLRAQGFTITHMDLGGGLGVPYRAGEELPSPAQYGAMVARVTQDWDVKLIFEPGRVIAGNAGVLLTRVIRVKKGGGDTPFIVVDAAMNDLARPALYGAWHDFEPVLKTAERQVAHVVGPICETGDTFATDRKCAVMRTGDLAIFRTAGAYGATMASSYNSRGFVAEVLVDGDRFAVVADRISPAAIMDAEKVPSWL